MLKSMKVIAQDFFDVYTHSDGTKQTYRGKKGIPKTYFQCDKFKVPELK